MANVTVLRDGVPQVLVIDTESTPEYRGASRVTPAAAAARAHRRSKSVPCRAARGALAATLRSRAVAATRRRAGAAAAPQPHDDYREADIRGRRGSSVLNHQQDDHRRSARARSG